MEKLREEKRGLAAIFWLCPVRHVIALLCALVIGLHLVTRGSYAFNAAVSDNFVRPVHKLLSRVTAPVPFSVAELLIALAVVGILVYIPYSVVCVIRGQEWLKQLYRVFVTLGMAGLVFYGGFCLLWGEYFYADDFVTKAGLRAEKISVEELKTVTAYFAGLANEYAPLVSRDENGVCATDRRQVLEKSPEVYRNAEKLFPVLQWPEIPAKPIFFSRIMSYLDFTGFFFPFTAEANVNTDYPPSLFASTVAHELAHQRGAAKEQEANFVAVLASLEYGDADYCYSASLLAYIHLGNALYEVDRAAWEGIYSTLDETILRDFAANRAYWSRFETPVQTVSNTVYENFLYSYDQDLGLKSYGACVDLLVNYYIDKIP